MFSARRLHPRLVKAMGMTRLCEEIDEKVKAFLGHPLEGDWPYLWIDATYVQVRESGRIVSVAVIVAVAVNSDGRREVLGMDIDPSEAETFWTAFLRKLARGGVRGVKLMISDAHEGIKAVVAKVLHASWQRRRTCTSCAMCSPMPAANAEAASKQPLERLNGEIKRRTDVVGIFPNEGALARTKR